MEASSGAALTADAGESVAGSASVGFNGAAYEENAATVAGEPPVPSSDDGFVYAALGANTVSEAPEPPAEVYPYDTTATYTGYEYGYGYNEYDYSNSYYGTGAEDAVYPLESTTALVDSTGYFNASDGNADAWQGDDDAASAYNASTYYGDNNDTGYYGTSEGYQYYPTAEDGGLTTTSGYDDTGVTTAYPQSQPDGYSYGTDQLDNSSSYNDGTVDSSTTTTADSHAGYYNYDTTGANASVDAQSNSTGDWDEVFDPQSNRTYYVNRVTGESAWELPPTSSYDY